VAVHCWPESLPILEQIAKDPRLHIEYGCREPKLRKKDGVGGNSQFLDKIDLTMGLDCDISLYLDADTTIHGDLTPLLDAAEQHSFVATQWNDWVTTGKMVSGRIRGLLDVPEIPNDLIEMTASTLGPSVNGGVWAAQTSSPVLPLWYRWTLACKGLFISDERVLHLMQHEFPVDEFAVATDKGMWNSSPKHQSQDLPDEKVIVRHYHGDSNVRPDKSEKGFIQWWGIWTECLKLNVGGCADWWESAGNRWMKKLGERAK
jgi:hypothetical protein